ncbi:hypothetical protein NQ318_014718 [Aromia moschata]|uniref:Transposase n=1 Tax=Aromia moschata TaxID=1265417 RepID=A0AAV8ZCU1_9CUCU|nr:hypothetical protein NQ318_014718 [Aromia moschata]
MFIYRSNQSTQLFTAPLEADIFEPVALYSEKPQFGLLSSTLLGSRTTLRMCHIVLKVFKNLYDRLGETGSFRPKRDSASRPKTLNPEQEEQILVRVAENSELSTRHIAMEIGVSKSTVWKVLKKEGFHPYHFTPVQNLIQDFQDKVDMAVDDDWEHEDDIPLAVIRQSELAKNTIWTKSSEN